MTARKNLTHKRRTTELAFLRTAILACLALAAILTTILIKSL